MKGIDMVRERRFPIVADDQPVTQVSRAMAIYDNEDLISNISDDYVDKNYEADAIDNTSQLINQKNLEPYQEETSFSQQAREEAKRDVREKRHRYLAKDLATRSSHTDYELPSNTGSVLSVADFDTSLERNNQLTHLANRLRQTDYILAELPRYYQKPDNRERPQQVNSYDFLKTSQVYNHQERKEHREQVQELNLVQLEEGK